jgi:hypothetical protein
MWFLVVEYRVGEKVYKCTEQLTYTVEEKYKIGKLPVGYHAKSAIENLEIGSQVRVMYNPEKPKKSYLIDNNGKKLT